MELTLAGTQRALFSMLFGAGMLLFISRLEKKSEGLLPAELYYRRQLWLLFFGLINTYLLLWFWDILFMYAVCGMLLFPFRRLSPKALFIAAGICLLLVDGRRNLELYREKKLVSKGEVVATIDTTRTRLTLTQQEHLGAYQEFRKKASLESKKEDAEKNIRKTSGNWSEVYEQHSERGARGHTVVLYYSGVWDVLLFMFLGMAFYKTGILTGQARTHVYWLICLLGLGIGLPLTWLRLDLLLQNEFDRYEIVKNTWFSFNQLSRAIRSTGIFGLIMLLYKSGWFGWLFRLMRPVGQMAFTNYLMQSIICGLFFYGIGFGMFGRLERHELYYVVAAVWTFQIMLSHVWMRYFLYGPFEWAWRSLTYWKKQPFAKQAGKYPDNREVEKLKPAFIGE